MAKKLIRHGNSHALVIDKNTLLTSGLDPENALFQITTIPGGGITIQSVQPCSKSAHEKAFDEVLLDHDDLIKRLAKR